MRVFLIGLGVLYLISSIPTMLIGPLYRGQPWPVLDLVVITALGVGLIAAGALYYRWAPRWLSGR